MRSDILFERIYERFSYDPVARGTFLECLEPYILADRLTAITPSVMKDFVDHYADNAMLQQVEACIVHLDIASLDIHQVTRRNPSAGPVLSLLVTPIGICHSF